ncbi:LysR family transcriptional regulator [Paraburkholderia sp. SIMBA_030]|uniref:helix-turn-helix domain-containing protein n=1 Tax=Paraburkholderia sp. SIMBA_030 TaxID=3085773 RepID=UPI00397E6183
MDLMKRMQYFVRVADCKSFTSAAEHLNVSTATASRFVSEHVRRACEFRARLAAYIGFHR